MPTAPCPVPRLPAHLPPSGMVLMQFQHPCRGSPPRILQVVIPTSAARLTLPLDSLFQVTPRSRSLQWLPVASELRPSLCVLPSIDLSGLFSHLVHSLSLHPRSSVRWLAASCPLLTLCLPTGSAFHSLSPVLQSPDPSITSSMTPSLIPSRKSSPSFALPPLHILASHTTQLQEESFIQTLMGAVASGVMQHRCPVNWRRERRTVCDRYCSPWYPSGTQHIPCL